MTYLLLAIVFFIALFVWLKTGRSPFWWGAMAFIWAEALRLQLCEDLGPACVIFARRVRDRASVVRQDIRGVV